MRNHRLSPRRVACAYTLAVLADFIQLPINMGVATGVLAIPAEFAVGLVDIGAMAALTWLLGFHWALLPTFVFEAVPGVSVLPTWTGCVAFVVWQRRKEDGDSQIPAQ